MIFMWKKNTYFVIIDIKLGSQSNIFQNDKANVSLLKIIFISKINGMLKYVVGFILGKVVLGVEK